MSEHKPGPSTISVPTKKQRSKQKVYRVRFPLFFDETPASLRLITRDKKFLIFKPQIRERERERDVWENQRSFDFVTGQLGVRETNFQDFQRRSSLHLWYSLSLSLSLAEYWDYWLVHEIYVSQPFTLDPCLLYLKKKVNFDNLVRCFHSTNNVFKFRVENIIGKLMGWNLFFFFFLALKLGLGQDSGRPKFQNWPKIWRFDLFYGLGFICLNLLFWCLENYLWWNWSIRIRPNCVNCNYLLK